MLGTVTFADLVSGVTDPIVFGIAVVLILLHALKRRAYFLAFTLALANVAALLTNVALKGVFRVPRPEDALILLSSWSFPSGHAVGAVMLAYTAYRTYVYEWGFRTRVVYAALFVLLTLVIGGSRLYLGVHRPEEVLFGFVVGIFFIIVSELILRVAARRR